MDWWLYFSIFINLFLLTIAHDTGLVRKVDVQQDERIRLECTVTSKLDAEEVCVDCYFLRLNDFYFYRR